MSYSRKRRVLTAARWVSWRVERKFFDAETETVFADIEKKLPGIEIVLQNANKAEDKFVVAASNDRTPGARYIYDARADTLSMLGDINPRLPEAIAAT